MITYESVGTAKVRGRDTRHTFCALGCGLEIITGSNVQPHFFSAPRLQESSATK